MMKWIFTIIIIKKRRKKDKEMNLPSSLPHVQSIDVFLQNV